MRIVGADSEEVRIRLETVWRIESGRIVAVLARLLGGDVGRAEEIAQDTVVVALEQWTIHGIPRDPAPWLMATAKHRAIDVVRRQTTYVRKLQEVGREMESRSGPGRTGPGSAGRADRRRPAPADLHRHPPRAAGDLTDRAHAEGARRTADRRARSGVPDQRVDGRPAHRAGQANPARAADPPGAARPGGAAGAAGGRARGDLPDLQRGVRGHRRRGLDSAGPVRRGGPARPAAGRR